jgi:hypothetical protein
MGARKIKKGSMRIETKDMIDIDFLPSSQEEDKEQKVVLAKEASQFLLAHKWCGEVVKGWLSIGWGDMLAVFLFEIIPNGNKADKFVWVVNGDLPSAYIEIESAKNWNEVLRSYVNLMEDWVYCVVNNLSTDKCYPIGVSPTKEYAEMLNSRIQIIKEEILG